MDNMTIIIFLIVFLIILIEWRLNFPFGTTMMVLCPIPPFIKRVRVYGKKWIGFDSEWKFLFLKETEEV